MVNADYLENLAQHRYGTSTNDEKYLDKFVDIRLALSPSKDALKNAVIDLARELPLAIPFGETESFSIDHAANLAGELAEISSLSLRKIKRILLKVELAMRCYAHRPLDASLLIFLAFKQEVPSKIEEKHFARGKLTPRYAENLLKSGDPKAYDLNSDKRFQQNKFKAFEELGTGFLELPDDRYPLPKNENYYDWAKVFKFLAPHYIPSHLDVLNAVAELTVPDE
jgi:hypothetical protein